MVWQGGHHQGAVTQPAIISDGDFFEASTLFLYGAGSITEIVLAVAA